MTSDPATLIEECFRANDGDGEFCCCDWTVPYTVIVPPEPHGRIVFATKRGPVSMAVHECAASEKIGMIGRCGLPERADLEWIGELTGGRELLFLGDLDPVDLMIFAWLRARLSPKPIVHVGINDWLLASHRISPLDSISIDLSPSEKASLKVLQTCFSDYRSVVGPQCAAILDRNRKMELEALVSRENRSLPVLLPGCHY